MVIFFGFGGMKRPIQVVAIVLAVLGLGIRVGGAGPYSTPVRTSWTEDAGRAVTFTWDRATAGRGTVEYGLASNALTHVARDGGGVHHHVITVRDLTPGTRYEYRASSDDGYEQWGTFRTAPEAGQPLHFAVHPDLHGGLSIPDGQAVADGIVAEEPQWVIHIGDMADEAYGGGPGFTSWGTFFSIVSNELARHVFILNNSSTGG